MQTPSHFLLTAVLNRQLAQRDIPVASKALLVGSVLPDIPFLLLTVGFEIYYRWFAPLPVAGGIMEYLHFEAAGRCCSSPLIGVSVLPALSAIGKQSGTGCCSWFLNTV